MWQVARVPIQQMQSGSANEWFDMLDAPSKEEIVFDGAGHRPQFDRPGKFAELMRDIVRETYVSN